MNIDFFSDLVEELRGLLKDAGYTVPTFEELRLQDKRNEEIKNKILDYDLRNLLVHCFTVYSRRVPVIKWEVHVSTTLQGRNEIKDIVSKLKNGIDINPLLSTKIKRINQSKNADLLNYEWGIFHLHLHEKRTDDLLFVYLNKHSAYLIDIMKHEKKDRKNVTWTNTNLIEIIHSNWPQVIKPFIFKSNSLPPVLNIDQRRALRKNGVSSHVVLNDGTEYMPTGCGYTASKHPVSAVIKAELLLEQVKVLQTSFEANVHSIKHALEKYTSSPKFKLKINDNLQPFLIESSKQILLDDVMEKAL